MFGLALWDFKLVRVFHICVRVFHILPFLCNDSHTLMQTCATSRSPSLWLSGTVWKGLIWVEVLTHSSSGHLPNTNAWCHVWDPLSTLNKCQSTSLLSSILFHPTPFSPSSNVALLFISFPFLLFFLICSFLFCFKISFMKLLRYPCMSCFFHAWHLFFSSFFSLLPSFCPSVHALLLPLTVYGLRQSALVFPRLRHLSALIFSLCSSFLSFFLGSFPALLLVLQAFIPICSFIIQQRLFFGNKLNFLLNIYIYVKRKKTLSASGFLSVFTCIKVWVRLRQIFGCERFLGVLLQNQSVLKKKTLKSKHEWNFSTNFILVVLIGMHYDWFKPLKKEDDPSWLN